jgi:hypothetical protein
MISDESWLLTSFLSAGIRVDCNFEEDIDGLVDVFPDDVVWDVDGAVYAEGLEIFVSGCVSFGEMCEAVYFDGYSHGRHPEVHYILAYGFLEDVGVLWDA